MTTDLSHPSSSALRERMIEDMSVRGFAEAAAPSDWRPPCLCCGGRMIIVETFERGARARAPPSRRAAHDHIRPSLHRMLAEGSDRRRPDAIMRLRPIACPAPSAPKSPAPHRPRRNAHGRRQPVGDAIQRLKRGYKSRVVNSLTPS
jgi:hypothetical protein